MMALIEAMTGYLGVLFGTAADIHWMTIAGIFLMLHAAYEALVEEDE